MTNVQILGYTADRDTCEKCGRENLNGCVIVGTADTITGYYGPECAKQVAYGIGPRFTATDAQRIERVRRDKIRWWAREVHKHMATDDRPWLGQDLRDARFLAFVRDDELELLDTARQKFRALCEAAAAAV